MKASIHARMVPRLEVIAIPRSTLFVKIPVIIPANTHGIMPPRIRSHLPHSLSDCVITIVYVSFSHIGVAGLTKNFPFLPANAWTSDRTEG